MNTYPGILVAFDGIDGAGKTTQVRLLEKSLIDIGQTVITSKEPTDGPWGQRLRDSALAGRLPFDEELDAFIQDRQEHLRSKVIPALQAGSVVILDRYFYSTIAYQGIRISDYKSIEKAVRANVLDPDMAFWVDLSADLAVSRVTSRDGKPNLFERQHDLARAGEIFRAIATSDSTLQRVDGTLPIDMLHRAILRLFVNGPFKTKRCAKAYGCDDALLCGPRITKTCDWWNAYEQLCSRIEA